MGKTRVQKLQDKADAPKLELAREMAQNMAKFWYREWYTRDIKPHLTREQKNAVMRHISDLTLESAIWLDYETNFIEDFPELKPYSHSGKISGLQLVAVMEAIFEELIGKIPEPKQVA